MDTRRSSTPSSGFTMIEMLVVILIMMVIAGLGMPALMNLTTRMRLEGGSREATMFLQRARLEAIRANRPAVIEFEFGNPGAMRAFVDFDEDGTFNPDATVTEARATDFEVGRWFLPGRAYFWGPGHIATNDPAAIVDFSLVGTDRKILFEADGTITATGSIDLGDERDNFIRITVSPNVRTALSKYDTDTSTWIPQAQGGRWTWY